MTAPEMQSWEVRHAEAAARRADEMLLAGVASADVLASLIHAAEQIAGRGSVASILVLDKQGLLRNCSSPNLPADYLAAIDGLRPDPAVGTCAAAAATGQLVITPSFVADSKWSELKHLPMALGFLGAWSMPIKGPDERVLGTFGTYFRERRTPSSAEVHGMEQLAAAAAKSLLR